MIFSFSEKKFYFTVNTRCSNEFQIRCKSVMRFKGLIEHLRFYSTFGGGVEVRRTHTPLLLCTHIQDNIVIAEAYYFTLVVSCML